ncbi:LamG-like jellyroll fold domain-containing protein [Ferruginibacter profundus]
MKKNLTLFLSKFSCLFFLSISVATISNAQPVNGLSFDGGDDYAIAGPAGGFYTAGSSYTKEAWVLYTSANNIDVENILSSKDGFWVEAGKIHVANNFDGTNYDIVDAVPFTTNRWEHVAVTYDAATNTMKLYRNGVLAATNGAVPASASGQNLIGGFDDTGLGGGGLGVQTYSWKGSMDELRVYNVALTQANIQADMVSTAASVPANLQAYYNFDIGTAGGTNTGLTSLPDGSANAYTATLTNFALTGATSNWVESYAMVIPTATAATNITGGFTGFTANWNAPVLGTVNSYTVEVSSTIDFSSPVAGSPFNVAFGTNSLAVTGLTASTNYYYRVSADKTSVTGQGAFSNTITALAVLPVNLLSFSVSKSTGANLLQWSTASEINSKYFELLRSEDGTNFTPVSKIYSNGNSSSVKNYQYADNLSANLPPVYYYRLKMVDINGSFTYSDIVLVKNGKGITITVYPNPAQDKVTVNITDKNLLRTTASLSDISGKILQTINITQTVTTLDISAYQKGVYVLRLADGQSVKLVKE